MGDSEESGEESEEDYRVAELEEANARLMEENQQLRKELAAARRQPEAVATGRASREDLLAGRYKLAMEGPEGLDGFPSGTSLKRSQYSFPHKIGSKRGAPDQTEFVVESRLLTTVSFSLHKVTPTADGYDVEPADENDLSRDPARFVLRLCYADSNEIVKPEDLDRSRQELFEPPLSMMQEKMMIHGRLSWTFKLKFTSRDTRPSNRALRFAAVYLDDSLRGEVDGYTQPFRVISRDHKKKRSE